MDKDQVFCFIVLAIISFLLIFSNKCSAIILGSNNPFCSNVGEVICNKDFKAVCTDGQFVPVCLNGSPNCCNKNLTPAICNSSLIVCEFTSDIKPGSVLDIEILSGPVLPDVFNSLSDSDKFEKITGIAYSDSNPAFEINLKTSEENVKVLSVDLQDSLGNTFKNIPFKVIDIDKVDNSKIKILTLAIPVVNSGGATFTLNLESGTMLSGLIEVIDFFDIQTQKNNKELIEPKISKIEIVKQKKSFIFSVHGKNFAPNKITIITSSTGEKIFHTSSKEFPNTAITLFPSDIKLKLLRLKVSKDGRLLRAKFVQVGEIKKVVKSILTIATPRGIVSKGFLLKNRD